MVIALIVIALGAVSAAAQTPNGRWDGHIAFGELKVPFTLYFEGSDTALTGSFVNGSARVTSTAGKFANGRLHLEFRSLDSQLEASLADGQLKGTYGSSAAGRHAITAAPYCTCSLEGEAGPQIAGQWDIPEMEWKLAIARKGDDTLATLTRGSDRIGPLAGRFDGVSFALHYFDGKRAAVMELEPLADGSLDVVWKAPAEPVRKLKATRGASNY